MLSGIRPEPPWPSTMPSMSLKGPEAPSLASLVLISPAIGITPAAVLAKWMDRLALLPGLKKFAWKSILPEFDPYKYNSFATNAGYQVHRLTQSVCRTRSGPLHLGTHQGLPADPGVFVRR